MPTFADQIELQGIDLSDNELTGTRASAWYCDCAPLPDPIFLSSFELPSADSWSVVVGAGTA